MGSTMVTRQGVGVRNRDEGGWSRHAVREPFSAAPKCTGGERTPALLAIKSSSDTASWPAPAIQPLSPLALAGMGGDAVMHNESANVESLNPFVCRKFVG